ncbi:hypothetical protein HYH03_000840 [Edaphochlamys debaryana]|uniref:Alpha-type protein kinase domain-containing protein n=1 Tax=Edaphochlamys debaryana TaxID=47281 RepID=A0A835YM28_9CHLO|nr:hypothetical protein HYH03_000840 [Edaphochlamys debaryana]|eukprot:KAG2501020.1 hypothetical protein HYH03_000840 [Edaphochlamys debaryana]
MALRQKNITAGHDAAGTTDAMDALVRAVGRLLSLDDGNDSPLVKEPARPAYSATAYVAPAPVQAKQPELATSAITVVSHTHGRARREERGILRRELQEAIKYGRKERANPGRDGKPRWRYVHQGIVYITDESSRHEVTSWRLADAIEPPPAPLGGAGASGDKHHVVVVVDASGSMRRTDVPGYETRLEAVYDCLARDLLEPQIRQGGSGMEVSLIEMRDDAELVFQRRTACPALAQHLRLRGRCRASSHGNYLPALETALELLAQDAGQGTQLFLVFLSDGAPSDHSEKLCDHGYPVWQPDPYGGVMRNGKARLQTCPVSNHCRTAVRSMVEALCVSKVKKLGDLLGRDRVFVGTVAFGPPGEDYEVLRRMAGALPRSSFQKLGLSADCLRTAFTSLTSSLTTLRTESAGPGLTLRTDIGTRGERQAYAERDRVDGALWDIYVGPKRCLSRKQYDLSAKRMVEVPYAAHDIVRQLQAVYPNLERGIAHAKHKFAEGAERVVFQCTEVVSHDGYSALAVGPRLVAKSTRYQQHMRSADFHKTFCKTQGEAEELAQLFNRRLQGLPEWQVRFLPCYVYTIVDQYLSAAASGVLDVLVEEELEGQFVKWNNNAGGVRGGPRAPVDASLLGVIAEEDEDEEGDEGESGPRTEDVPQAFSHFSYVVTEHRKLVCDLQGVWNSTDGFTLTDPVIHHFERSGRYGATDKGPAGMTAFFKTHTCNALCRRLGLPPKGGLR